MDYRQVGRFSSFQNAANIDGNLTGVNFFTTELAAKRLALLRELVPSATRVAVLVNPTSATITERTLRDLEIAAREMKLQIQILNANNGLEINAAFETIARERPDALFIGPGPFFAVRRVQLTQLAARHAIPRSSVKTRIPVAAPPRFPCRPATPAVLLHLSKS